MVLGHVNRRLARHGRRVGPDPASTDIACVGGVIANNSGGMRCGVVADSYRTIRSMTFVLADGAVIDTAAPDAERALRRGGARTGRRPRGDPGRAPRGPRTCGAGRPQVRDQEHHGLPAVRLPRRRHAARDLPSADHRVRGHARVRRRGGVRDGAAPPPHAHGDAPVHLGGRGRRRGGAAGRARHERHRAAGGADPDRGGLQHAGRAGGVEGAPARGGRHPRRVPQRRPRRARRPRARGARAARRSRADRTATLHARCRGDAGCSGTSARGCTG